MATGGWGGAGSVFDAGFVGAGFSVTGDGFISVTTGVSVAGCFSSVAGFLVCSRCLTISSLVMRPSLLLVVIFDGSRS